MTTFSASFLDVGVGDCTLITLPDGTHMLVDVYRCPDQGTVDVFKVLRNILPEGANGKKRLEHLVITHAHDDHICGIGDLTDEFEIGELWVPQYGTKSDLSTNYDAFVKVVENHPEEHRVWQKGSRTPVAELADDTVTVRCFSPPGYIDVEEELDEDAQRKLVHENCGVFRFTFGGTSVMLTGDSNLPAWQRIVGYYDDHADDDGLAVLAAAVLHASHHGSRTFLKDTEADEPWKEALDAIDPDHVVISVGENTYGHPHKDILTIYEDAADVHRTDEKGTMVLTIQDDGTYTLEPDESYATSYGWDDDDSKSSAAESSATRRHRPPATPPPGHNRTPQQAPTRERYA